MAQMLRRLWVLLLAGLWMLTWACSHKFNNPNQLKNFQAPNAPSDPFPSNLAKDQGTVLTLRWTCSDPNPTDVLAYDVYLWSIGQTKTLVSQSQKETNYSCSGLEVESVYYWQIVARDNHGIETSGPQWAFWTSGDPKVPADPYPYNGATFQAITLTMTWTGGDPEPGDTARYDVYFDAVYPPNVLVSSNQLETSLPRAGLSFQTDYFWRVVARDKHGKVSNGPIWKFTTGSTLNTPPNPPTNPLPPNGATDQETNLTLTWLALDPDPGDSLKYDVYFDRLNPPTTLVGSNQRDAFLTRSGLSTGTTYYWRIVVKDSRGGVTGGPVWSFTTRGIPNDPPNTPSNPFPPDGATSQPTFLTISWSGGDPNPGDTVYYDVYFDTLNPPVTRVSVGQTGTTFPRSGLNLITTYYWNIVATDNHGAQTQGPVWRFTTLTPPRWNIQNSGTTNILNSVDFPLNSTTGNAVGYFTILKTTDGGTIWLNQSSSFYLMGVHFPGNEYTGYAVGWSGTIVKTTDGGITWFRLNSGTSNGLCSVQFPIDTNTGYVVGQSGTILKTTDGGVNWFYQFSGTTNILNSVDFPVDAQTGYTVGDHGTILKTTNGGIIWIPQYSDTLAYLCAVHFPVDATTGYATGYSGRIMKTTDGGLTWFRLPSPTGYWLNSVNFPIDALTGYAVGGNGTIMKTSNGGLNWTIQSSGALQDLKCVAFPQNILTGYAVGYNGTILKTTTGGE